MASECIDLTAAEYSKSSSSSSSSSSGGSRISPLNVDEALLPPNKKPAPTSRYEPICLLDEDDDKDDNKDIRNSTSSSSSYSSSSTDTPAKVKSNSNYDDDDDDEDDDENDENDSGNEIKPQSPHVKQSSSPDNDDVNDDCDDNDGKKKDYVYTEDDFRDFSQDSQVEYISTSSPAKKRPLSPATLDLLRQESIAKQSKLDTQTYACLICLEDLPIDEVLFLSCMPRAHKICTDCFSAYCSSKINEGLVSLEKDLICPSPNCKTPITIMELEGNLSAELMAKYNRFMVKSFGSSENCCFCPKCNEWFIDVNLEEPSVVWRKIQCQACSHQFCGSCGQKPHIHTLGLDLSMTCADYALSQKVPENEKEADELFKKFVASEKDTVFCPNTRCALALTLITGGCKFTLCRCETYLCFICGVKLSVNDHYRHFTGAGLQGPFGAVCKGAADPDIGKHAVMPGDPAPAAAAAGVGGVGGAVAAALAAQARGVAAARALMVPIARAPAKPKALAKPRAPPKVKAPPKPKKPRAVKAK